MPRFHGAVGMPEVGHHRWTPYSRRPLVVGSAYHKHLVRLMLKELRKGDPSPEYARRIGSFVLMLLVHGGAFFLLLVGRPPAAPPATTTPQTASVEVRVIQKHKTPPPPPPIRLPQRRPPQAKLAATLAMPEIAAAQLAQPKLQLQKTRPQISVPKVVPKLAEQIAANSKPAPQPVPKIQLSASIPKVVVEPSRMAVPPPELPATNMLRAKTVTAELAEIPVSHVTPDLTPGRQALQVSAAQPALVAPEPVTAAMPEVPEQQPLRPEVALTTSQTTRPTIKMEPVKPQAAQTVLAEPVPLAPVPQAPPAPVSLTAPVVQQQTPIQVDARASQLLAVEPVKVPDRQPAKPTTVQAPPKLKTLAAKPSLLPANDAFKPLAQTNQAASSAQRQAPGTVQLLPRGNSDVMSRNTDHLGYKPTIFEQYWAPANESLLNEFLRKFIEKLTVKHTFHIAPGVRVHCVLGPVALFLGCGGDPPRKGSRKGGDPRLDMAPARSLVPDLGAPSTAPTTAPIHLNNTAACDTARVAGAPPPPGCPKAPVSAQQSDQWHPRSGG